MDIMMHQLTTNYGSCHSNIIKICDITRNVSTSIYTILRNVENVATNRNCRVTVSRNIQCLMTMKTTEDFSDYKQVKRL